MSRKTGLSIICAFIVAFSPLVAYAATSETEGGFVIHYNAISTESLPASVANTYRIKRSRYRGLLNVSVLRSGGGFESVKAKVRARATNLVGQQQTLDLRQIEEGNAVYYIAEFKVSNEETFRFEIDVTTPDNRTTRLSLKQQYFTQ